MDYLKPVVAHLTDERVLIQAWKKTHNYIRRHNWYADVLELDLATFDLDKRIPDWGRQLSQEDYHPDPLRLVPAPKSGRWSIQEPTGVWQPLLNKDERLVLRPLAHASIRDQTLATSAMMCLADAVESAQGNPTLDPLTARLQGVSSYGNRLYCTYESAGEQEPARFTWGNAKLYRSFYEDYRAFLERPKKVAEELAKKLADTERLFVVSLDLSGFYDRIDLGHLLSVLGRRFSEKSGAGFWSCLNRIFSFSWDAETKGQQGFLKDRVLPTGLPQGLVASGFFANSYMLDLDAAIVDSCGKRVGATAFIIEDYCRYVDDMRLVVRAPVNREHPEETDWNGLLAFISGLIGDFAPGQKLNKNKTEVIPAADLHEDSGLAVRMTLIQQHMSGPVDFESLEVTAAALDGLLLESERVAEASEAAKPFVELVKATSLPQEVRDDTLKRFACRRRAKTIRERRDLLGPRESDNASQVWAIDHEAETTARRFIGFWLKDPSLVTVLRLALDLFPSTQLLTPVLAALSYWLDGRRRKMPENLVVQYVAADLLRAGATETGWGWKIRFFPDQSDLDAYRSRLAEFARDLLIKKHVKWYVKQQALLYLAVIASPVSRMQIPSVSTTATYLKLHRFLAGTWEVNEASPEESIPFTLLVDQLAPDRSEWIHRMGEFLNSLNTQELRILVLERLALAAPDRFRELLDRLDSEHSRPDWLYELSENPLWHWQVKRRTDQIEQYSDQWLPLLQVSAGGDNPFQQENSLLVLLLRLLDIVMKKTEGERFPTPLEFEVRCQDWIGLSNPELSGSEGFFELRQNSRDRYPDPRYDFARSEDGKTIWDFAIGRILRAAITGNLDYSTFAANWTVDGNGYHGLRTHWLKRQYGMHQGIGSLGGETIGLSPWLSGLLARLLQWPGARLLNTPGLADDATNSPERLIQVVQERLATQRELYGRASHMPVYVAPVRYKLKRPPSMTAVTVQTVLPRLTDFKDHGVELNDPAYRGRHRRHLQEVCKIVHAKLRTRKTFGRETDPDLFVFPELAVHPDDIDILETLAMAHKAMVFAGLGFHALAPGTAPVNRARWIVPEQLPSGLHWTVLDQGKRYPTKNETTMGIESFRPHQWVLELKVDGLNRPLRMSGAICFDATDLKLVSDLRDITDLFVIAALNQDVRTFDNMVAALHYHMYQHVILVNSGEFGGSAVQAPYRKDFEKIISHTHGGDQVTVNVFDIRLGDFDLENVGENNKAPPAGIARSPLS